MEYTALIVAAGKGQRMGLGYNKVFFQLTEDMTVLEKTISVFKEDKNCHDIVVVVAASEYQRCISKYQSGAVTFVSGGETRANSVFNGLMAVSCDKVLIHDGARPYLSQTCLARIWHAAQTNQAVIPVVGVKDTIKVIKGGVVEKTLRREELFQVQTPQAFDTELIIDCYRQAFKVDFSGTDDAQVVENFSETAIVAVEGSYENIKITTIEDLPRNG